MECFVILKWGTSHDDALLFLVPLGILLVMLLGGKLINLIKARVVAAREARLLELKSTAELDDEAFLGDEFCVL